MGQQPRRGAGGIGAHAQACAEAWQWLETNQLVCPKPGGGDGWHFITRKGEQFQSASEVREYVEAQELPVHFLNKAFIRDVRSLFLQARYDTAVFEAFRLLEVAIRERARLGNEHIGTKLAYHELVDRVWLRGRTRDDRADRRAAPANWPRFAALRSFRRVLPTRAFFACAARATAEAGERTTRASCAMCCLA